MRADILGKQEQIEIWINEHRSKSYMYRQLKCQPSTLDDCLKRMGIVYEGNKGSKGYKVSSNRKSASHFLNSEVHVGSHRLRLKLFQDKIKEEECECCGITEWNGDKAPLQLHHVDGNRYNNTLENLQILCANCHCLTDNHSGKKNKKLEKAVKAKIKQCSCGKLIGEKSTTCKSCRNIKLYNKTRPGYQTLIQDITELGYAGTGRKYKVSNTSIRKWIRSYEKQQAGVA